MKRLRQRERMEDPSLPLDQLREALDALDRTHRWFGTFGPVYSLVNRLLAEFDQRLRILDVGAGSGYLGRQLHRKHGNKIHYFRLDPSRRILNLNPTRDREWNILGRGPRFPVDSGCVDLVVSSLVLHHLPDHQLRPFLLDCLRLSRGYVIHHDLQRRRGLKWALWLLGRVLTRSSVYRHDATLSVRRSRTLEEWDALLNQPALDAYRLEPMFPWRVNLIAETEGKPNRPTEHGNTNRKFRRPA